MSSSSIIGFGINCSSTNWYSACVCEMGLAGYCSFLCALLMIAGFRWKQQAQGTPGRKVYLRQRERHGHPRVPTQEDGRWQRGAVWKSANPREEFSRACQSDQWRCWGRQPPLSSAHVVLCHSRRARVLHVLVLVLLSTCFGPSA